MMTQKRRELCESVLKHADLPLGKKLLVTVMAGSYNDPFRVEDIYIADTTKNEILIPIRFNAVIRRNENPDANKQQQSKLPEQMNSPLIAAIREFNIAHQSLLGISQKPLSEDEILGSVHRWVAWRKDLPVSDEEFAEFKKIAETRQLPKGSELELVTDFPQPDGSVFHIWSVRIKMPRLEKPGEFYSFTIREQHIKWDPPPATAEATNIPTVSDKNSFVATKDINIADAIAEFNKLLRANPLDPGQQPLTEIEFYQAIQGAALLERDNSADKKLDLDYINRAHVLQQGCAIMQRTLSTHNGSILEFIIELSRTNGGKSLLLRRHIIGELDEQGHLIKLPTIVARHLQAKHRSLAQAVKGLNEHPTVKECAAQKPFTEEEVVAAIHQFKMTDAARDDTQEEEFQRLQRIADTRQLPEEADFVFSLILPEGSKVKLLNVSLRPTANGQNYMIRHCSPGQIYAESLKANDATARLDLKQMPNWDLHRGWTDEQRKAKLTTLDEALAHFNKLALQHPQLKDLPPLTRDEALSAVRMYWRNQGPAQTQRSGTFKEMEAAQARAQYQRAKWSTLLEIGAMPELFFHFSSNSPNLSADTSSGNFLYQQLSIKLVCEDQRDSRAYPTDGKESPETTPQLRPVRALPKGQGILIRSQILYEVDKADKPIKFKPLDTSKLLPDATPLAEAITKFNVEHATYNGIKIHPLTEEEVVTRLKTSKQLPTLQSDFSFDEYKLLHKIIDSRQLPKGTELELVTDFPQPDGSVFHIWSVRIKMPQLKKPGEFYYFPLREQHIKWDPPPTTAEATNIPTISDKNSFVATKDTNIDDAVAEFNKLLAANSLDPGQGPITVDEFLAALSLNGGIKKEPEFLAPGFVIAQQIIKSSKGRAQEFVISMHDPAWGKDSWCRIRGRYLGELNEQGQLNKLPPLEKAKLEPNCRPLAEVIKEINDGQGLRTPVVQKPLTEEEVIASIYNRLAYQGTVNLPKVFAILQKIVETRQLPSDVVLEVTSDRWESQGKEVLLQLVQLKILATANGEREYKHQVRQRLIKLDSAPGGTTVSAESLKNQKIAWGEEDQLGLQLGLRLIPESDTYSIGQKITPVIYYRNNGKHPWKNPMMQLKEPFFKGGMQVGIRAYDEADRELSIQHQNGIENRKYAILDLQPGEAKELEYYQFSFQPIDMVKDDQATTTVYAENKTVQLKFKVQPGADLNSAFLSGAINVKVAKRDAVPEKQATPANEKSGATKEAATSKAPKIAFGKDSFRDWHVGLRLIPEQETYEYGQKVTPVLVMRNDAKEERHLNVPNVMTPGYYTSLQAADGAGQRLLPDYKHDIGLMPVGWRGVTVAPGALQEVRGLPIVLGDVPYGGAEMSIKAKPESTIKLSFQLPMKDYDPTTPKTITADGGILSTGEVEIKLGKATEKLEAKEAGTKEAATSKEATSTKDAKQDTYLGYEPVTYLQQRLNADFDDSLWGEKRDGLRLALINRDSAYRNLNELPKGLSLSKSISVTQGEEIQTQLLLENKGDKAVNLSGYTYTEMQRKLELFDAAGKQIEVKSVHLDILPHLTRWQLLPGERYLLQMPPLHLHAQQKDKLDYGYFADVPPGDYTLVCGYKFDRSDKKDAAIEKPDATEWTGTLTTGPLKVKVVAKK